MNLFCGRKIIRFWIEPGNKVDPALLSEERAYAECPSAFWLRPDGDYLSDTPYIPTAQHYDVVTHQTYFMQMEPEHENK